MSDTEFLSERSLFLGTSSLPKGGNITMWSRVRSWLRAVTRRSRLEREMDAELRFHIEAFAEDLVRNGVPR